MTEKDLRFRLLSFLLLFLFGGAIVGETVSLSMAVTAFGSAIMGKLFLINGALLLLLPPFFFSRIDRVNRGKLLSNQLLFVFCILFCYLALFTLVGRGQLRAVSILILLLYPVSYLSKTTLFLTFWTLANDIYSTDEAKKGFPKIAAMGFAGGLIGACAARLLLEVIDAEMIIGLWALAYLVAFGLSRKIAERYWIKFIKKEVALQIQVEEKGLFAGIGGVLSNRLIRLIAILYFLVFIAIFLQDFLFWNKCAKVFKNTNSLASFQFTFYLAYSFVIIGGLRFVMPGIIIRWGFTRIFSLLPTTLLLGSFFLLCMCMACCGLRGMFVGLIIFQFLRYVVFENAFSPIYQMFFAVIPREQRGRAKTFLDGMVKPAAIILAGLFLMTAESNMAGILLVILITSAIMIFVVYKIRRTYTEGLILRLQAHLAPDEIIAEIGCRHDQEMLTLIKSISSSFDSDIRCLAVKILSRERSKQALLILNSIYKIEKSENVREMIAYSIASFDTADIQPLIELMLKDGNPRIRANALFSLNAVNGPWKQQFFYTIKSMFFENNLRVQIEAAIYLWGTEDEQERENVLAFLRYLLIVKNANKRSGGLHLVGVLRPDGWESMLLSGLHSFSYQIFQKSVETIFIAASKKTQLNTLRIIDRLPRRHIAITGRVLQKKGAVVLGVIMEYLSLVETKRMMVELVHAMRVIAENDSEKNPQGQALTTDVASILSAWIIKELEIVYKDCVVWATWRKKRPEEPDANGQGFLEDALREHLARVCEWAMDVAAMLDPKGVMVKGRRDLDLSEHTQRFTLIELLDNFGPHHISMLIAPILRNDPWEQLAKTGRGFFKYEEDFDALDNCYFFRSSNRWVSLCAFYYLFKMPGGILRLKEEKETLEKIKNDHQSYLAKAAAQLLSTGVEAPIMKIEALDLLERVMSLKKTPLFGTIPAEKLMELAELTQRLSYKKGTLISREGELSDHLYIVATGSLKIVKVKNNVKTILNIVRKGETYGEIGLFNQAPRSASAVANEDCDLWVLQRSPLKKMLLDMPEIAYNLLEVFSEKLRKSGEELAALHATLSSNKMEYTIDEE
jgi:hypothetical protein